MNLKIPRGIVVFALGVTTLPADVVFEGYMMTPERTLFILSVDQARPSGWLAIGQKFAGFEVVAFERKPDRLTVEKDGKRQVLPLVESRIRAGNEPPTESPIQPIVVAIEGFESFTVGEEVTALEALKKRFVAAAAMIPQPTVVIWASERNKVDRIQAVLDLCSASGIRRFSVRGSSPNQTPAPDQRTK